MSNEPIRIHPFDVYRILNDGKEHTVVHLKVTVIDGTYYYETTDEPATEEAKALIR